MRRIILTVSLVTALGLATAATAMTANGAGGVTGPALYVNGQLYRTVGTPTDLSNTGAPASSFDTIYDFGGLQPNVATAAPGDPGYNGGRWMVRPVLFNSSYADAVAQHDLNGSGNIDTNAELAAIFADPDTGGASAGGVVKEFECPVIHVP
ncbi:MAG TPA: hypothetical protein VF895_06445 [Gaiellaceae bacterium]